MIKLTLEKQEAVNLCLSEDILCLYIVYYWPNSKRNERLAPRDQMVSKSWADARCSLGIVLLLVVPNGAPANSWNRIKLIQKRSILLHLHQGKSDRWRLKETQQTFNIYRYTRKDIFVAKNPIILSSLAEPHRYSIPYLVT